MSKATEVKSDQDPGEGGPYAQKPKSPPQPTLTDPFFRSASSTATAWTKAKHAISTDYQSYMASF